MELERSLIMSMYEKCTSFALIIFAECANHSILLVMNISIINQFLYFNWSRGAIIKVEISFEVSFLRLRASN